MKACKFVVILYGGVVVTQNSSLRGLARMIFLSIYSHHDLIDLSLVYGNLFLNVDERDDYFSAKFQLYSLVTFAKG